MSIHAPNKKRLRREFWKQLQERIGDESWIILGDFNQVELPDDSRGKSAVISGREERIWRQMVLDTGLVDGFLCAACQEGVRFTRFARRRLRYDYSRLDRIYFSNGAVWIDHVREVRHFSANTLSDHVPIMAEIQLVPPDGSRKPEGYFKRNYHDLLNPETLSQAEEVWSQEAVSVKDSRRRWTRGWERVSRVLKVARNAKEKLRREEGDLAAEVHWRREQLSSESSTEEIDALHKVEQKLKERDLHDARLWKLRSRDKWLEEDTAPSRYFFTKLRARWARESLEALETQDGNVTTDKEEILSEVHNFYRDQGSDLQYEDQQGSGGGGGGGGDGLTVEIVKICWDFVDDDCVAMIHTVWAKRKLLKSDLQAIIRLIHKGGDRKLLGNWRPISLMKLTYKIVAKLLANRVKFVLPSLVDMQQSGFVMGRRITDNVLSLKFALDWAKWSDQKALFLKLDFIKAAFTPEILVLRGVRHGCPLAPLLYALASQPFMSLLNRAVNEGRIAGLQIEPGHSLVHQLFADDTGVCIEARQEVFSELLDILRRFELASGARINLAKSLVMPLGTETVPEWVSQTGCVVAEEGVVFKYLGVSVGVNLPENASSLEIVRRMKNRLFRWEHHLLPWEARVIVLKHILLQIPSYPLLTVGCDKKQAKQLERVCAEFLWGVAPSGKPKKALVAWARMIQPKEKGGLRLPLFLYRSRAMQMRHVVDLLEGRMVEWSRMAVRMLHVKMLTGPCKKERKHWSCGETLLLLSSLRTSDAPTLDRLLRVWFAAKRKLCLTLEEGCLPSTLPITSLKRIWALLGNEPQEGFKQVEKLARENRLECLRDCCTEHGEFQVQWLHQAEIAEDERGQSLVIETVEHLVWGCVRLRFSTQWIGEASLGREIGFPSFLQVLDASLQARDTNPVLLFLVSEHCKVSWLERNQMVFNETEKETHPLALIASVAAQVKVYGRRFSGAKYEEFQSKMQQALSQIHRIIQQCFQRQRRVRRIFQDLTNAGSLSQQDRVSDFRSLDSGRSYSISTTSSDDSSSQENI
ncbi:hypothetical protein R1sor_003032 [Riccia sorocarpa]|uniref:Reverse transcriptase domain-containing protein n=1 Tax=Riccia sorocarpa TaxID=122646 RepID=A0ABD3H3Q5_9MARC